jgi:hypothetical protein
MAAVELELLEVVEGGRLEPAVQDRDGAIVVVVQDKLGVEKRRPGPGCEERIPEISCMGMSCQLMRSMLRGAECHM